MNKRKEFSQNFLKDINLVRKIIYSLDLNKDDQILEIGAGNGIITGILLECCKSVLAVEKDKNLYFVLKEKFKDKKNLKLVNEDFLKFNLNLKNYKIVSNIPFSITSGVMNKILYSQNIFRRAFLIVQREAAFKYMGVPFETQYSILTKPYFSFEIIYKFSKTDFDPMPSVNAVLLRIERKEESLISESEREAYIKFVKYGFNTRKKNLKSIYRNVFSNLQFKILSRNLNFPIDSSASQLSFDQWISLFKFFNKNVPVYKRKFLMDKDIDISNPKVKPSFRKTYVRD